MSAYAKLRRQRQLFVDAYVRTGIGSEAAKASGYSAKAPDVAAAKLLANIEVKAAVVERTEEAIARAGVRHVQVLEGMARLAYASVESLRGEDGKPKSFKDLSSEFLAGVASIDFNPDGSVKSVKLAKTDGLNMLGKHLKLFTDVVEVAGKDGGPIQTEHHEVSDLEKARRIAHLLAQGLRAQHPASVLSDPESGGEPGDSTAPSTSATSS